MSPTTSAHQLERIIDSGSLLIVFQPIIDFAGAKVLGYEALTRGPVDSPLHSPVVLFEVATRLNLLNRLEYACREAACRRFSELQLPGKLFLNVSPMTLVEDGFEHGRTQKILGALGLPPERVVIEISEQYPLDDYSLIRDATLHYRQLGFEIAIDDLGAGYSGLRVWSELKPDYVKVDRHFVENISEDPVKREFLRSFHEIGRGLNCKIIAEGIETEDELDTVRRIGIIYGQGFLLGRPRPHPASTVPTVVKARGEGHYRPMLQPRKVAGALAQPCPHVPPSMLVELVTERFHAEKMLDAIPVVEDGVPVGLALRQELLELFSVRYSRELHGRKPIRQFMNRTPVIVEDHTPLEDVSRLLTATPAQELGQNFIVTRSSKFIGIGRTRALLQHITEQQIRSARYSNPLTLLPGNVPLCERIDQLLQSRQDFRVAYCDLNQFKPYNDVHGYSRGDEVIQRLGELLVEHTDAALDFVAHIGGDDFMLLLQSPDWQQRCQKMLDSFALTRRGFYNEAELAQGGIRTTDRHGKPQFFELLTLAIGVAAPDLERCTSHHDVAALATDAKHEAKMKGGNTLFISRRRGPVMHLPSAAPGLAA